MVIIVLVVTAGVVATWAEPEFDLTTGLWWSIVTLTTVGYGDFSPATLVGRIVAVFLMILGIGVLGAVTASIASTFIERQLREERGLGTCNFTGHLVICGWNDRAEAIVSEVRADMSMAVGQVVVIADLDHKPIDDDDLYFVKGIVDDARRPGRRRPSAIDLQHRRGQFTGRRSALSAGPGERGCRQQRDPQPSHRTSCGESWHHQGGQRHVAGIDRPGAVHGRRDRGVRRSPVHGSAHGTEGVSIRLSSKGLLSN